VEGSSDGAVWIQVDRRENSGDLNDSRMTRTFGIAGAGEWRMIRMRQTGKNQSRGGALAYSAFEVFGDLIE